MAKEKTCHNQTNNHGDHWSLDKQLLLFKELLPILNLFLPSLLDNSISFADVPIDLSLDITPSASAMMGGKVLTASIPLLVGRIYDDICHHAQLSSVEASASGRGLCLSRVWRIRDGQWT